MHRGRSTFTGTGAASPIAVGGLANGTAYACSVTATNSAGTGPASATATVTPATVPGAPTIGAATPGNGSASIAFAAPGNDGGSPITGYTASCTGGGSTFTGTGAASPIAVGGLANGTAYRLLGDRPPHQQRGDRSRLGNRDRHARPPSPGAPTIGAATPGNGSANIAFAAPGNDGGSPITGYTASCGTGGSLPSAPARRPPPHLRSAASPTAPPTACSVTATNSAGPVPPRRPAAPPLPPAPPITPPLTPPGNGSASIAFAAPGNDGGSPITGYTASCTGGGLDLHRHRRPPPSRSAASPTAPPTPAR